MDIGLMPFFIAEGYGVKFSRRGIFLEWPMYQNIGIHDITLSISHRFGITSDLVRYRDQLSHIAIRNINPVYIGIENEELLHYDVQKYCDELAVAINVFAGYEVTNGGFPAIYLSYWYYRQVNDTDFFKYNIPGNQKQPLLNGERDTIINAVQYELNQLKILSAFAVNVHYYMSYATQAAGLVRMFKYISEYVGKPVVCNEAGIYRTGLLPVVVDVARQAEMVSLILYSGEGTDGSGLALPISKELFLSVNN